MKEFTLLSIPAFYLRFAVTSSLLLFVLSTPAHPQRPTPNAPPPLSTEPPTSGSQSVTSPATVRRHIDLAKLQADADEMSNLAQTIPADLTSLRHNMLPKDVLQKLKRIEKLSKHLRRELTP